MTTHRPSLEGSMTEGRRRHTISVLDVSVMMESQALMRGTSASPVGGTNHFFMSLLLLFCC